MANMKDYIESFKENQSYDWISRHGWELTKDELISIIKELDYAIGSLGEIEAEYLYESVAEELKDRYLDDDEE